MSPDAIIGSTVVMTVVIIVFSLAATLVPIFLVFRWLGKMQADKRALLQAGAFGHARVLQLGQTGMTVNGAPQLQLVVEVTPATYPGYAQMPPFQTSFTQLIPMMAMARVQPGAIVPVRYDPANPARMTIDFGALGYV